MFCTVIQSSHCAYSAMLKYLEIVDTRVTKSSSVTCSVSDSKMSKVASHCDYDPMDPWLQLKSDDDLHILQPLVEKVFSIPATSAPVERVSARVA